MKQTNTISAIGLDIGTMNIVCSSSAGETKSIRNVFITLDESLVSTSDLQEVSYIKDDEGNIFIVGQSAFTMANIFGKAVNRPMEKGLISPKEISSIDILGMMIKSIIDKDLEEKKVTCCYSVPAQAIDEGRSILYHQQVFARILGSLKIKSSSVNEGMAIIFSETQEEKFSGIAISFGAGMTNVAVSWRGVEVATYSTVRGGDWIDLNVANSLGTVPNRVTNVKEKYFDLNQSFIFEKDKKRRRILEALEYYYTSLIDYSVSSLAKQIEKSVDLDIAEAIPLILSGGTSLPNGFDTLFEQQLRKYSLPLEISSVRRAKNPLTAVASGLLVKALVDSKNTNRKNNNKEEE